MDLDGGCKDVMPLNVEGQKMLKLTVGELKVHKVILKSRIILKHIIQ